MTTSTFSHYYDTTEPRAGYGERVDAVVYGSPATADYTPADWARLALAALDQAGLSRHEQERVRGARSWPPGSRLPELLTGASAGGEKGTMAIYGWKSRNRTYFTSPRCRWVLFLVLLPACAGDPFVIGEDPATTSTGPGLGVLDGGTLDGEGFDATPGAPDAGAQVPEAGKGTGASLEAGSLPDAAPPLEAAPKCSAVTATFEATCGYASAGLVYPYQFVVSRYEKSNNGCLAVSDRDTPVACQCAETFNCACLESQPGAVLSGEKCEDLDGAPWVW